MEERKKALSILMEKFDNNGIRNYLVKWDTEDSSERYSWEPEEILEGHEDLISNYWRAEPNDTTDVGTQTSDSIWVSQEFTEQRNTDVFLNYSPSFPTENSANLGKAESIPIKIMDFNRSESKFLTLFADEAEARWCPCLLLLSFSPKLVAEFFINRDQNGGL